MKRISLMTAAACLAFTAPLAAQTWSSNAPIVQPTNKPEGIYLQPYPASANFCPQGLQPVTMGGVICCGTPNTTEVYSHGGGGKRSGSMSCQPGTKGCS